MHNKKVKTYTLFLLFGLFVWTAVECGEFAAGAGAHLVSIAAGLFQIGV